MQEHTAVMIGVLGTVLGILLLVSVLVSWGMYTKAQSTVQFRIAVESGLQQCQNLGNYDEHWSLECN